MSEGKEEPKPRTEYTDGKNIPNVWLVGTTIFRIWPIPQIFFYILSVFRFGHASPTKMNIQNVHRLKGVFTSTLYLGKTVIAHSGRQILKIA